MDIISTQKFIRISPKKMRVVADVARKLSPLEAIERLPFLKKRGSETLVKVIKSALANAKEKGLGDDVLAIKEIQIGEGPRLKRGRAASRGRWHPYKKRMSHIRVVLTTRKADLPVQAGIRNTKSEKGESKDLEAAKSTGREDGGKDVVKKDAGSAKKVTGNIKSKLQSAISRKGGKNTDK